MADEISLQFGPYRLDAGNARLWRETQAVRLTPKAFHVLCYVVARPGQLVSKEELFTAVWPDTVISDATLTGTIQEIRKALQDNPREPQYLETVPKRGFRFIGSVISEQLSVVSREEVVSGPEHATDEQTVNFVMPAEAGIQEPQAQATGNSPWTPASAGMTLPPSPQPEHTLDGVVPAQRSWSLQKLLVISLGLLISIVLAVQYFSLRLSITQSPPSNSQSLPMPDKPSLIVLPLVNLSGDPEQEYFSDGLTEVLTGDLSRIASLFVIARNSAFTYKGKAVKVQDVSKEMGVRYVLEGSVQKANQRVRVNVQLIDATTGYQMWAQQYDRPLTDIFAVQDEVVQKIVTTLKLQLTLEEQGYILRKHTNNVEAYDAFLQGQTYYARTTQEGNGQARQLFEKAVALDPQYADAYAGLGLTYLAEWLFRWGPFQVLEQARALEQRALALDDSLPSAHSLLGLIYAEYHQYEQAVAEGERAITLAPNDAGLYANLTGTLNFAGRHEEARRTAQQALRLNPHAPPSTLHLLGWSNMLAGRYGEAITVLQEVHRRNPTFPFLHTFLAISYFQQWLTQQSPAGQTLELAQAEIQQALALNDAAYLNHLMFGYILLWQRQYDQALAEMERAVTLEPTMADSVAAQAAVLGCMGRTEEALQAIDQALPLKPGFPDIHLVDIGSAYAQAGRYEEAREALQRFLIHYPNALLAHLTLTAVYSELGQDAEAQAEAREVLRINPHFSLAVHRQRMPITDSALVEHGIAALRKAGLK